MAQKKKVQFSDRFKTYQDFEDHAFQQIFNGLITKGTMGMKSELGQWLQQAMIIEKENK